ncbi:GTP-binding protein HflX [Bartonella silvatica]|uniref:GTPase HflX n=1 Tax=Bartonella silvatica TaxID=357760 RepID=A0ABV2HGX7_9HYPH
MINNNESVEGFSSQFEKQVRTVILVPIFPEKKSGSASSGCSIPSRIKEVSGLAGAIRLKVVHSEAVHIFTPRPATLFGKGKVDEIAHYISEYCIDLTIVDDFLTPVQQRNLEKLWNCKVIDRTALILEIFGDRARTKEGRLQVELAHLSYQKSRLVRSWTHLERQRGGRGFLGGPGETQIEADRRLLQEKIIRIRRELEKVIKTRALHRSKRKKASYPVVALVGYTNTGKSTLFNRLSGADVLAKDMLFATLDPTLRKVTFPHGKKILLSDTVGFISHLPTHLIAAFRATLEEVVEADLILHVRDMSDPDHHAHAQDVLEVLSSLGIDTADTEHIIEVWNKIDLLDEKALSVLKTSAKMRHNPAVMVSALMNDGLDQLLVAIEQRILGEIHTVEYLLKPHEMSLLDWFYENSGEVVQEGHNNGSVTIKAVLTTEAKKRLDRIKKTMN